MLLDAWRLALGTLTVVPVQAPRLVDRRRAALAMTLAPVASLPLAAALAAVVVLGHWLDLPALVTALLAVGATILGNRGLHLDGLSDVADGLAASYDAERSLRVMKSGTSGPAGVVAIVLVLGLQAVALTALVESLGGWRAALVGAVALCVSRVALAICCMQGVPPARTDGLGRIYTQTVARPATVGVVSAAVVALAVAGWGVGLPWWRGALAVLVALGLCVLIVVRAVRRFGGVTGDVFGACVEVAFAALLVALS